jgi:hypothetical protein
MLSNNPFLYRAFRPGRGGRWRQLLLALTGPAILLLPTQLATLFSHRFNCESSIRLSLFAYVAYLCIRSIGGSVGKISQERERGSWDVLLSVGMSRGQIGWGLWLSSLLPVCLEVTLTLPWLLTHLTHWAALLALLLGLGVFYSSLALYASLRFATSLRAAQVAYGWLGLCGGGSFLVWLFGQIGDVPSSARDLLLVGNPWALVAQFSDRPGMIDWIGLAAHWVGGLLLGLALQRQLFAAVASVRGPRGAARRVEQSNPLLYRNQFQPGWRRLLSTSLLYAVLVLAPCLSSHKITYQQESLLVFCLLGHLGFWLLRSVQSSSHMLCREREQGTLEALLTTRLGHAELLRGIWAQTVAPISRQALWLSPLLLVPLQFRWGDWLLLNLLTQIFCWAWGAAALAFSMGASSTVRAFQGVYLSLAFLTIGTLVLDISLIGPLLHYNKPLLSLANPLLSFLLIGLNSEGDPGLLRYCWVIALGFHLGLMLLSQAYLRRRLA